MPQHSSGRRSLQGRRLFHVSVTSARATRRHRVRRNVVDVGQPRGPVFQIIRGDDGTLAEFAGAQPPGADFFAQLRGADDPQPREAPEFRRQWAVVRLGICGSDFWGAVVTALILLLGAPRRSVAFVSEKDGPVSLRPVMGA